jgi:hypothetical protein
MMFANFLTLHAPVGAMPLVSVVLTLALNLGVQLRHRGIIEAPV